MSLTDAQGSTSPRRIAYYARAPRSLRHSVRSARHALDVVGVPERAEQLQAA
jgi:hypothetical protein